MTLAPSQRLWTPWSLWNPFDGLSRRGRRRVYGGRLWDLLAPVFAQHLKKRNGHLLKTASGHLATSCEAESWNCLACSGLVAVFTGLMNPHPCDYSTSSGTCTGEAANDPYPPQFTTANASGSYGLAFQSYLPPTSGNPGVCTFGSTTTYTGTACYNPNPTVTRRVNFRIGDGPQIPGAGTGKNAVLSLSDQATSGWRITHFSGSGVWDSPECTFAAGNNSCSGVSLGTSSSSLAGGNGTVSP